MLVGALAGAAGGGYAAAQERGVDGAVSDLQIETNIESAFAAAHSGLNEGITTTVGRDRFNDLLRKELPRRRKEVEITGRDQ